MPDSALTSLSVLTGELRRRLANRAEVRRSLSLDGIAGTDARLPADARIDVDLTLEAIAGGVVATGTVTVPWQGSCRRCLGPVDGAVAVEVREVFEPDPTEGETWPLGVDRIDLEPLVRETAVLALPLAPLCGEGCQGPAPDAYPAVPDLDPAEGAERSDPDPRWAALDQFDFDRD